MIRLGFSIILDWLIQLKPTWWYCYDTECIYGVIGGSWYGLPLSQFFSYFFYRLRTIRWFQQILNGDQRGVYERTNKRQRIANSRCKLLHILMQSQLVELRNTPNSLKQLNRRRALCLNRDDWNYSYGFDGRKKQIQSYLNLYGKYQSSMPVYLPIIARNPAYRHGNNKQIVDEKLTNAFICLVKTWISYSTAKYLKNTRDSPFPNKIIIILKCVLKCCNFYVFFLRKIL